MNDEWGTPVSKEKIIARRNRLIEYQKTNQVRFTALYQIIDENILDINYMIYEIERLNNIINKTIKYVESLSSSGRGCDIYEDIKQEILKELKGSDKE